MAENKTTAAEGGKLKEIFSSLIFYLAILTFIIGFNFSDTPLSGGWTQQFMPPINNRPVSDITFLDSLIGYAVTGDFSIGDTNYVLKTINGGDNWTVIYSVYRDISTVKFINTSTGFICGGFNFSCAYLAKTTNGGLNWFTVNAPCNLHNNDIAVLNEDTMWLADRNSTNGGIFRTTNGGINWLTQANFGSGNPDRIYMYNGRFGFANRNGGNWMYRTTNSGLNWEIVSGTDGFNDIYFADTLTGWKAFGSMKKSTDGGLNWVTQTLPQGGDIQVTSMYEITNINSDTIWGVGGQILQGSIKGMIYRTTNSGANWLFQVPDISPSIPQYIYNDFVNKLNGWAYPDINRGIHTVTGGGDTFYTTVKQNNTITPDKFYLGQNYPNPFDPITNFKLRITNLSNIQVFVYDINGKLVTSLVDKQMQAGEYLISFDGSNYSSGIYFYSLYVDGNLIDTKKMILIK